MNISKISRKHNDIRRVGRVDWVILPSPSSFIGWTAEDFESSAPVTGEFRLAVRLGAEAPAPVEMIWLPEDAEAPPDENA